MDKFESPAVVKRELQVEFGEKTPGVDCIRNTLNSSVKLARWKVDNVREDHAQLLKKKIDEVHNFLQSEPQSSVRTVLSLFGLIKKYSSFLSQGTFGTPGSGYGYG